MSSPSPSYPSLRRYVAFALFVGGCIAAVQAGCGNSGDDSQFGTLDPEAGASSGSSGDFGTSGGLGDGASDADPDALGTLVITPPSATITVTVVNGVPTVNAPVTFTASYNGAPVAAQWLFDRGELGDVSAAGVFTANGKNVGDGTLTARFGAREGNASIKVLVNETQNGALGTTIGGYGGLGGVGGEATGGPVTPAAVVSKLHTDSNPPGTAAELGWLYPYDNTVWPRGLLAPLLMWQSTHAADAVWVRLSQANYTYEGTFSYTGLPAGDARRRVRLEDLAWKTATGGNAGDPLKIEVKVYVAAEDKVYGPITETWKVASGVLKGTVYYNSYDSHVTTGGGAATGGVIAIKPRSPDPVLAVPSQAGKCHVCHEVSADGSTLWAQDYDAAYVNDTPQYARGASYDLTKPSPPKTVYDGIAIPANDRKFVWSAPYPDGSFALASSRYAREAYTRGDSKLFARSDGSEVVSTGMAGVVASAVTPAFSPDGRKVVFNFWTGAGSGTVTQGGGQSLAVFDFTCGAAPGSTACAPGGPHQFSGLREIFRGPATTYPSWPTFLPDGKAVIFNNELARGTCSVETPDPNSVNNCHLTTWFSAKSQLWIARDSSPNDGRALVSANGVGLPTNGDHPDDTMVNYQPTVNPVPSGGYYWVVFTSRRMYGNRLVGKPWGTDGQGGGPQKKLWVAAVDINAPAGIDPSHPAFYLPGQELEAGNSRGFWVVDPCKSNGNSCESGDECCNGFCRKDSDGALVCSDKPPGTTCVQEFEKCTVDGDCCDPTQKCIAGKCAQEKPPGVK